MDKEECDNIQRYMVQFKGKELPNHGGWFEIRIHKNNHYGDAVGLQILCLGSTNLNLLVTFIFIDNVIFDLALSGDLEQQGHLYFYGS